MEINKPYTNVSFDDIVFENRNKQYGSYLLRKLAKKHTLNGLLLTTSAVLIFVIVYLVDFKFLKKSDPPLVIDISQITLSDPPPILESMPPAVPPSAEKILSKELAEMEVKNDDEVADDKKTIAKTESDSIANGSANGSNNPNSELNGNGKMIYLNAEVMPEYPGGKKSLIKYLQDNLVYPLTAKENGITGTVTISFVIDEDGSVTNAKVEKGIGGGCDQEALRIVREMRKWKPGRQGDKYVRVQTSIPITFALQN
jgi:periplasmic protein TonB